MKNKNRITDKDYTWQELNCFYRPFAYSFCSTEYGEKGANGEKMLFGNSRNLHLVVFRADVVSYELHQEDYAFEKDMAFKAVRGEKTISLYISDDGWKKVYEAEQDFPPVTMGAFIKTWEQCDMDVEIEADAEYYT